MGSINSEHKDRPVVLNKIGTYQSVKVQTSLHKFRG